MKVRKRERKDEFELQNKEETFYRLIKEPKQIEKKEETDSGMKYLQILLYFVQDAALFQMYLILALMLMRKLFWSSSLNSPPDCCCSMSKSQTCVLFPPQLLF